MTAIGELPGPAGLPGLGNALQLRPERLHLMIEQWGRRYGPVFRFSMGPREVVGFTDPDAINAILRERPHGYRRWREVEAVANEIGVIGPFTSEGDDWKRQRRLAVTALNTNHLRRYFDVIRVATDRLHARLAAKERGRDPRRLHGLQRRRHVRAGVRPRPQHARARRRRAAGPHRQRLRAARPPDPRAGPVLARVQAAGRPHRRALARGASRGEIAGLHRPGARAHGGSGPSCARRPRTSSRACSPRPSTASTT